MERILGLVVFSSVIFLLATPVVKAQAPPILEGTDGRPLWISAEAAADEEKIIDLDLIGSDHLRGIVEKQSRDLGDRIVAEKTNRGKKPLVATIPESECRSRSVAVYDHGGFGSGDTLAHLATYSKMIVRGTIRTVDVGFSLGAPSSLLGVEVSEVLKGSAPTSPFYIDYPVARFKVGPLTFCNVNKGFEPQPGDQVLLFAYSDAVGQDEDLFAPRFDQMLFQGRDGNLLLPSPLKDTPEVRAARTLNDVIGQLRIFLSSGRGRR